MTIKYLDSKRISLLSTDRTSSTSSDVTGWTLSGFSSSTNSVTKTGGTGWNSNEYARSTDSWTVGSGEIDLTFSGGGASHNTQFGFNQGSPTGHTGANPSDFAIYMAGGDILEAFESGTKVYGSGGTRSNEVFNIKINNSGLVTYWADGVLKYTSTATASGTYYLDAHGYASGSPANNISVTVSTDTTPANVETNSILIEKDTADRYWFDGSSWTLET